MKKFIFLLLLSIAYFLPSAQADTIEPVVEQLKAPPEISADLIYNDVKDLFKYSGVKLDSIATKAVRITGNTIENLWDILVAQQLVKSLTNIFILILQIISFIGLFKFGKYIFKLLEESDWETRGVVSAIVIFATLFIIQLALTSYTIHHLGETITGLVNPRFGALLDLAKIAGVIIR
jgi:hypothetical protein